MNLIAIILTLIGGGLREGLVNSDGKIIKNSDIVFEQAGAEYVPCEIVEDAVKVGLRCCYVYEFNRYKLEPYGPNEKDHNHLYCYKIKNKKDKNKDNFLWYYFVVPCKKCQYICGVREPKEAIPSGVMVRKAEKVKQTK